MKINLAQLGSHLSRSLAPIYIVSGEEPWQKAEIHKQIRNAAKKAEFSERIRLTVETGFEVETLYHALYSTSLLSEKRLVELDLREATPSKALSTLLKQYAAQPLSSITLLILMGKLDDKTTKSAWYAAIDKSAVVIPIWPISREYLPKWIMQNAATRHLTIKPDAAKLLADCVEGNLVAAGQALEKLSLLYQTEAIDSRMLYPILTQESQFNVFDLIDSLLSDPPARGLNILNQLKLNDVEPAIVLWSMTRELRLLTECAEFAAKGQSLETVFKKNRVFPRRQPVIKSYIARTNVLETQHHLSQAIHVDHAIKSGSHDPWEALALLCLRIAK